MHKNTSWIWYVLIIILLTAGIAAAAAHWTEGEPGLTFRTAAGISLPCLILSVLAWSRGGKGKTLAVMMFLAFVLRLAFGLGTVNLLPIYGHPDERREEKGYLFDDAWRRDAEAWAIVSEEDISFTDTLTRSYHNDQYGGLTAMTIWLYKYISPDARRFPLIMVLGAFFAALGLPFLWNALDTRWGRRVCLIGCWIYTLYPDAVFFSGAPMREPFLNGIICAAFWALATYRDHKIRSVDVLVACAVCCLPFSSMVAVVLAGISIFWIWAEFLVPKSKKWLWGGIILMVLCILSSVIVALPAFKNWIHYDIFTTEVGSGWVEKVVGEIGGQFRSLFVAVYGLTQPVLPAIAVYPVAPACDLAHGPCTTIYWKVVGIFRAAGWYILVPFLLYAVFSTVRIKDKRERFLMVINAVFVVVWLFISSLRAGGDQIDNPRYRVIFLPWLAFMAAWGIDFALKLRDWWLVRWIAIEMIFLGFFTQWYYSRYSGNAIRRYPFWRTVIYIVVCSAVVAATGLIEKIKNKKGG
ncbi:MAG: hypothetical protein IKP86_14250 [Anaerolineaceae bacterium]|nr:hypothetical protein [Anaerolineaceae bacterium]